MHKALQPDSLDLFICGAGDFGNSPELKIEHAPQNEYRSLIERQAPDGTTQSGCGISRATVRTPRCIERQAQQWQRCDFQVEAWFSPEILQKSHFRCFLRLLLVADKKLGKPEYGRTPSIVESPNALHG